MEQCMLQDAVNRIRQMEMSFDALEKAVRENPSAILEDGSLKALLNGLLQYYESGQWLQDYELDEQGLLPQDLKRGILAQDTLFDFFDRIRQIGCGLCSCETPETVI